MYRYAASGVAQAAYDRCRAALTLLDRAAAEEELRVALLALGVFKDTVGQFACGGDWVVDEDTETAYTLPTESDGVWHLPKVNVSQYTAVLEEALQKDSDAGWQVLQDANGTRSKFSQVRWLLILPVRNECKAGF